MNNNIKHIVSFSGGKDSTAMLLMMLEKGMKIDEIIFLDTTVEFPEMYEHINKVEKYIGRTITKLKTENDFEQVSKLLNYKNVGRNTLFKILRDNDILTMKNFPYQKYVELEYFKLVEGNYIRNGEIEVYLKTVVSQKGIEFIDKLLSDLGYVKKVNYNEDNSN